ncbi:MAG TPA: serine/threonine-protein kinase [Gemmatimonadaceae bacterium]|nr:serine/threonine-protein kinase [Gemmatimonadaceae bacterium]
MSSEIFDVDQIGPYHVVQVIGEGGMGIVYEAEQREPVRRRVAVKMMKIGMDTKQVVGRFEMERQALAVMDHPGIAKVLDAGVGPQGRPFFAMELVAGVPIDRYCNLQRLTTPQRLELIIAVCEAMQHAHQKGVIHRDIKPSNILVKEDDGRPRPKIIDFGIAKATGHRMTQQTVVTSLGQALGTLAYMSPEQAEMSGLDVDTRTDVYALGIILHEVLTDRVPIDPAETGDQSFVLRLMQRDDPLPTLSQTLSRWDASQLQAVAASRRTDVQPYRRELAGDLKWIVSKAIEKDRNARYQTANALAMDLRHYLDNEPVLARAPSASYRLRKFVRRNRRSVAAAAVAMLALVAGTTGTTIAMFRARDAEARAAREAEASAEVANFLAGLFSLSDPAQARGRTMSARELLDSGATRVVAGLRDQPHIRARLKRTIGEVYMGLGLYNEALPLLDSALATQRAILGHDDPQTLLTAYALGDLAFYRGEYGRAESLFVDVAQRRARVLGETHPLTIRAQGAVGTNNILQERWAEAESILVRAHAAAVRSVGRDDPETLLILNNLQGLYYRRERFADAEAAATEVLAGRRRQQGPDHPESLNALHNLATVHAKQGRFAEAEREFLESLEGKRRVQGAEHPRTLWTRSALANLYDVQGRHAEAEAMYRENLAAYERTVGLRDPGAQRTINYLIALYTNTGRPELAATWSARLASSR